MVLRRGGLLKLLRLLRFYEYNSYAKILKENLRDPQTILYLSQKQTKAQFKSANALLAYNTILNSNIEKTSPVQQFKAPFAINLKVLKYFTSFNLKLWFVQAKNATLYMAV